MMGLVCCASFFFVCVYISSETWAEGVHEGPPCFYPYVGGGGERCPAKVAHPGLRFGHEPDGDWQVLTEGCEGDYKALVTSIALCMDLHFTLHQYKVI